MDPVSPESVVPNRMVGSTEGEKDRSSHTSGEGNTYDFGNETKEVIPEEKSPPSSTEESVEESDEYPHGLVLLFIVVAIVLSIFLVSIINGSFA